MSDEIEVPEPKNGDVRIVREGEVYHLDRFVSRSARMSGPTKCWFRCASMERGPMLALLAHDAKSHRVRAASEIEHACAIERLMRQIERGE